MTEEQRFLAGLLVKAVNLVYMEDRFLLTYSDGDRKGLEQAFVFRAGVHLAKLLQGTEYEALDLDSEYNKNHGVSKRTFNFRNGLRPDLIVHRRDSNLENKLVAQFKGYWAETTAKGREEIEADLRKLQDFTDPLEHVGDLEERAKYKYDYVLGVFVRIGNQRPEFRYFTDGQETDG
jgi:hypothetical protein